MKFIKGNPLVEDFYYVKVDSKADNIFSTICEFVDGHWDLKNIEHNKQDLTEDSEVICWLDEREIKVPSVRVRFFPKDSEETFDGTVIEETEYSYLVIPDDNLTGTARWNKKYCDTLR